MAVNWKAVNWRDLVGGLVLLAIGAFFAIEAARLGIGTTRRMGAGYFPLLGGIFTMVAALLVIAMAFVRGGAIARPAWRPVLTIFASIAAFILVMPRAGLIPAIVATVLVAACADRMSRPIPALLLAVGLSIGAWLIFIVGLGLPIRPYRMPF